MTRDEWKEYRDDWLNLACYAKVLEKVPAGCVLTAILVTRYVRPA